MNWRQETAAWFFGILLALYLGVEVNVGWFLIVLGFLVIYSLRSRKRREPEQEQEITPTIGIALDEPIEVSPGYFRTANSFIRNAKSPKEVDKLLRIESLANPDLANALEQNFGWKDGNPAKIPVVNQILGDEEDEP